MKKIFFKLIVIVAVAIVGTIGYNIGINQENSDRLFMMKNTEALAGEESSDLPGIIAHCANSSGYCTIKCPDCKTIYGSKAGKLGPISDVLGMCQNPDCKHVFQ